ncbi:hypothetical protein STEG23_022344, partial [Scotinomys teguina]
MRPSPLCSKAVKLSPNREAAPESNYNNYRQELTNSEKMFQYLSYLAASSASEITRSASQDVNHIYNHDTHRHINECDIGVSHFEDQKRETHLEQQLPGSQVQVLCPELCYQLFSHIRKSGDSYRIEFRNPEKGLHTVH